MDRIDPPADLLIPRLFDSWIRLVSYLGNIKEDSRKREPLGRRQFQGISCDIGKSFHGEILLAHAVMSRGDFFLPALGIISFLTLGYEAGCRTWMGIHPNRKGGAFEMEQPSGSERVKEHGGKV